jgi:hypothetical protein
VGTGGGMRFAAAAAEGTGGASGVPADHLSRVTDAAVADPGAEASSADASGSETTGGASMVDNGGATMIAGASDGGAATSATSSRDGAPGASALPASGAGGATSGSVMNTDTARYSFESSTQSWAVIADSAPFTRIGRSAARHFAGVFSLAVSFAGESARSSIVEVMAPRGAISPGAVVTFHLFVEAEVQLIAAQPYLIDTAARYLASYAPATSLKVDDWTTLRVRVPSDAATIERIGVKFTAPGVWAGAVYLDSIDW